MKIFSIIGIDYFHYEDIKLNAFLKWIMKNTKSAKDYQLALTNQSLQNYFMSRLISAETRFVAHLAMFTKPQTKEQKLELYMDYLSGVTLLFPKALQPKVTVKETTNYQYN